MTRTFALEFRENRGDPAPHPGVNSTQRDAVDPIFMCASASAVDCEWLMTAFLVAQQKSGKSFRMPSLRIQNAITQNIAQEAHDQRITAL